MSRNDFFDFTKGVLIILVVCGHVIQSFGYHDNSFYEDPVFKFIYIFHMPLFMFVSGYLSVSSYERRTTLELILSKLKTIVLPAVLWSALLSFFNMALSSRHLGFGEGIRFYFQTVMQLWFIWDLLVAFLVVGFARLSGDYQNTVIAALIAILMILPDYIIPGFYKYNLVYFCIGYCLSRSSVDFRLSRFNFVVCAVCSLFVYVLWRRDYFVYEFGLNEFLYHPFFIFGRFFSALLFCLTVYEALRHIHRKLPCHLFSYLGKRTLLLYIVQPFFMRFGYHAPRHINSLVFYFVVLPGLSVFIIAAILSIEKMLALSPFSSRFLLGRESRRVSI